MSLGVFLRAAALKSCARACKSIAPPCVAEKRLAEATLVAGLVGCVVVVFEEYGALSDLVTAAVTAVEIDELQLFAAVDARLLCIKLFVSVLKADCAVFCDDVSVVIVPLTTAVVDIDSRKLLLETVAARDVSLEHNCVDTTGSVILSLCICLCGDVTSSTRNRCVRSVTSCDVVDGGR